MADIIFYSVMELLTAFAPNFTVFLMLRALYGIGMGGEWGLGASLAMESLPTEARGLFSGILQQGYAFGYLLAAVVYWIVFPFFGWRGLVRCRRAAGAARDLHSRARPGIAGLAASRQRSENVLDSMLSVSLGNTGALFIYAVLAHDRVQLHVARHTRSLSDLSRKTARLRRQRRNRRSRLFMPSARSAAAPSSVFFRNAGAAVDALSLRLFAGCC